MTDRDTFLREVDEAVRQDQYKQLWDRYGVYALGVAVLVVAGVAGYKGWTYWQEKRAQDAGAQFSQALARRAPTPRRRARSSTGLAQYGPEGYRVLARFQLAAAEAKAGETDKAVADYDALAVDPSVDPILQGHATLQAAALRLDKADYAEMERRLKPLDRFRKRLAVFRARAARAHGLSAEQYARGRDGSSARWSAIKEPRRICGSAPI